MILLYILLPNYRVTDSLDVTNSSFVIDYMDVTDSYCNDYFMKSNQLRNLVLKLAKEPELRFFCNWNRPATSPAGAPYFRKYG